LSLQPAFGTFPSSSIFLLGTGPQFYISSAGSILVTGCIFAMWLGERKITDKGIDGISLLIMVGVLQAYQCCLS
jgi:preprotein translocase subunit SecY